MGNSSLSVHNVQCFGPNLSSNSVTPEFWETHSINSNFHDNALGVGVVVLLLFLVGFPSNILVIVSMIREKLYKEATQILLLNLTISDLVVCTLVMPFTIVAGLAGEFVFGSSDVMRCSLCEFVAAVFTAMTLVSVSVLAVISVDRFIFIKFPLQYSKIVRIPVVIVIIVIFWLISILIALLPLMGFGDITFSFTTSSCIVNLFGDGQYTMNIYYVAVLLGSSLLPVILVIVFNIWLAAIVNKQIWVVYRTKRSCINREELRKYNQCQRKIIRKKRNRKHLVLVKTFGGILLVTIIVWMPLVIHVITTLIFHASLIPLGNYSSVYLIFIMHSVLHPLIEGWMIPDIKFSIKSMLGVSYLQKKLKKYSRSHSHGISDSSGAFNQDEEGRNNNCCELCTFAMAVEVPEMETTKMSQVFNHR